MSNKRRRPRNAARPATTAGAPAAGLTSLDKKARRVEAQALGQIAEIQAGPLDPPQLSNLIVQYFGSTYAANV